MPNLEDLETFVEVADSQGVSAAARRLGVSKSIISRRLQRLEDDLGVRLLARTTRGSSLTEAGATFREHAARIASEMDSAREEMSPEGDLRGRLRISAPLSFGATHLAPVFAEFARRHPRLQIHTAYADRVVDLVGEGFDVAIRIGFLRDSTLVARRIAAIGVKIVASPSYLAAHPAPTSPDEIAQHEALMQANETWRLTAPDGKSVTVRPQGRFRADNGAALAAAAVAGIGIVALPDFLTDAHIASGALVPVLANYPMNEGGLYVVRPPGGPATRKVRALTELLVEHFGRDACG